MRKIFLLSYAALVLIVNGCEEASFSEASNPSNQKIENGNTSAIVAAAAAPVSIYGSWHCGNDACTWATVRTVAEFDSKNHWLIDRGDGRPSVNLVVLSFVNPLTLLNQTTDAGNLNGVPRGITPDIVNYFKSRGIRVMLSIGGITYTDDWNAALAANPTQFGLNAAAVAQQLGVGIEIDYEENTTPNLSGLQAFINAYRSVHPYDATGNNHAARLTIDLAAGDRWLIAICREATAKWLTTSNPVLVDGKSNFSPVILPLAPAKFTGAMYLVTGRSPSPECTDFNASLQKAVGNYVQNVAPNGAGTTSGMLGMMFWASEMPSTRRITTAPPNSCEGGMGAGATFYNIPIPMPALRQQ
jgi:hypothetical protein